MYDKKLNAHGRSADLARRVLALRVSQSNGFQACVSKTIEIQRLPARRPASIQVRSEKPFAVQKDESIKKPTLLTD